MSINLHDIVDAGLYFGDFPPSVLDIILPVITVNGGTTAMLQGGTYTPPTVEATDNIDGVLTVNQTGTIDVNVAGTQTVYFDAQDAAGNDADQASHTVVITALDSTPTQFSFADQIDVALDDEITSNAITVLGINTDSAISITGGEYSVNGGTYTANAGTVSVGDTVTVRVTSSGISSTPVGSTLTIGGVSDTFIATTLASVPSDSIPAQFNLGANITGASLNAVTVRSFTIADIDTSTTFNATGDAEVSADGSTNWGSSFTVSAAGTGYMRLTASGSNSTAVTGGVESGGISDSITLTTVSDVFVSPPLVVGCDVSIGLRTIYKGYDNPVILQCDFSGEFGVGGLNNFIDIQVILGTESYKLSTHPAMVNVDSSSQLRLCIGDSTELVAGYYQLKVVGFSADYDDGYVIAANDSTLDRVKVVSV